MAAKCVSFLRFVIHKINELSTKNEKHFNLKISDKFFTTTGRRG
jgi:hypothetical protein